MWLHIDAIILKRYDSLRGRRFLEGELGRVQPSARACSLRSHSAALAQVPPPPKKKRADHAGYVMTNTNVSVVIKPKLTYQQYFGTLQRGKLLYSNSFMTAN